MRKLLFSLLLFLAVVGGLGYIWETSAQEADQLTADAGPDQTVAGPSPVMVHFLGKANTEEFNCVWFNQWDRIRANGCDVTFPVNFGNKEAKPGTTRSFLLDVSRPDGTGGSAYDWVTITLGDATAAPTATPTPTPEPPADPAEGHTVNGMKNTYELWGCGGNTQDIIVGTFDDGRWYVQSTGAGEDCIWGNAAIAECFMGLHWQRIEDGVTDKEGCVSSGAEQRDLVLSIGAGGWYVLDRITGEQLAKLTPRSSTNLWIPNGATPLP